MFPRSRLLSSLASALALALGGACGRSTPQTSPAAPAPPPLAAPASPPPAAGPAFVGREVCAPCHERQTKRYEGSRHDLSMQPATEATVLGDFSGASFEHFGVTTTFSRQGGKFLVRTDGPDGALADFEVTYVFGVYPLQQVLLELPGGRLQALSVAWDARAKKAGGQRWFHLYPGEAVPAGDILHWTGPEQNWNFMCAECHSTNLRKNWNTDEQRYETAWSEIDVSCEACHGPGSAHVAWARAAEADPRSSAAEAEDSLARGLVIELRREPIEWVIDPATGMAKPERPPNSRTELEMCARCHARRSQLFEENVPGRPLLDAHKPALLDPQLYFADGQQLEEVYEYGSFLQSRMHAVGVSCGNCHDAHSGRIDGRPDDSCLRCHAPERFATPAHHHHQPTGAGASCVECHMPTRDYMVIDARRDHSLRVPRPDLTLELGTPNACAPCHADKSAAWAQEAVAGWYPEGRWKKPHPGRALEAGRRGRPGAEQVLAQLVDDREQAPIVRASALDLLGRCLSMASLPALERALADPDGLVRSAAVDALAVLPPPERMRLGYELLSDPLRGVRIEAASALAGEAHFLNAAQRKPFDAALAEYRAAQATNADRPEAWANLGSIAARLGQRAEARRAYEQGLRLGGWLAGLWINLADLCREEGDEAQCESVLRRGLEPALDKAAIHHALGLCLARQQRLPDALGELKRALELAPGDARHAYVYGIALHSAGNSPMARDVLTTALALHPADRDLLYALATLERDLGSLPRAREYARRLVAATNGDPGALALLQELQAASPK